MPRDLETIVHKAIDARPGATATRRPGELADRPAAVPRRRADPGPAADAAGALRGAGPAQPGIAGLGGVLAAVLVLATVASLLAAGYFNQCADAARPQQTGRSAAGGAPSERRRRRRQQQAEDSRSRAEAEAGSDSSSGTGPTTRPKSPSRISITRRCTWPSRRGGNTAACRTCANCSPTGFPRTSRPTAAAGSGSTSTRSLTKTCEP